MIAERSGFFHNLFLSDQDTVRCQRALLKLAKHIKTPIVLTGGLAVSWHAVQNGLFQQRGPLSDLDLVVNDLSAIRHSICQDFLLSHFHPSRSRGKILVQLVDEANRLRIDVFTSCSKSLNHRLLETAINEIPLRIISAEDLTAKLCEVISAVLKNQSIEAKYFHSFKLLFAIADLEVMKNIWTDYRNESLSPEFEKVTEAIQQIIADHPERLQKGGYCQNLSQRCQWCQESQLYPLAPRVKVFEILGYV